MRLCRARTTTRGYARPQVTVNASYGGVTICIYGPVYTRETNKPVVSYTRRLPLLAGSLEKHGIALSSFRRANNLPARALLNDNDNDDEDGDDDNAVARGNCIRKYYRAHVFSEVDRNKPSACRDANRKCNVGSKERQRTCSNNNTKLHCKFVVVRCMTSDGLSYWGFHLGTIPRRK